MLETASATTPRLKADTLIEKLRRDEQNPNRKPNRRKFMSTALLIIGWHLRDI